MRNQDQEVVVAREVETAFKRLMVIKKEALININIQDTKRVNQKVAKKIEKTPIVVAEVKAMKTKEAEKDLEVERDQEAEFEKIVIAEAKIERKSTISIKIENQAVGAVAIVNNLKVGQGAGVPEVEINIIGEEV